LHQLRKDGENRWWIAAPSGRFAGRKPDFTDGTSKPGYRVHHEQDFFALIAKIFSNGRSRESCLQTLHGALVRGRNYGDATLLALRPKSTLYEFANFPAPFTNQGKNNDINRGAPGKH